jgi:AraC-like DNA-binding protein
MTEETLETQVIEDITENTEETVEETLVDSVEQQEEVKQNLLTEEQLKERLARQERSLTRKFEKELNEKLSKYQQTEMILQKGLEVEDIEEANKQLKAFYEEKGINIPEVQQKQYSDWEVEVLAKAEAEQIIEDGFDEMEKEADRLAAIGFTNLNKKDKTIFNTIAERLVVENNKKELSKNGIDTKILEDNDFKQFSQKFKATENVVDVYNLYKKQIKETKEIKPIGSMKTDDSNKIKDYYTPEEARQLTVEDYKKNPSLKDIIVKSAGIWRSKGL